MVFYVLCGLFLIFVVREILVIYCHGRSIILIP